MYYPDLRDPASEYDAYTDEGGRELLVSGSYHRVEQTPVSVMGALTSVQEGIIETAYIAAFIFIIGGSFGIVGDSKLIPQHPQAQALKWWWAE